MNCEMKQSIVKKNFNVYPESINCVEKTLVCLIKEDTRYLLVSGAHEADFEGTKGSVEGVDYVKAPLNHKNACALRALLPFTAPSRRLREKRSFGCGDRLGIATPGHIRLFKDKYDAYPILAQQSIRELNLTERGYEDVMDCVTFNVLQEGYTRGWGADGDHLKKEEEIQYALGLGFTMLTLDCSEHIHGEQATMSDIEVIKNVTERGLFTKEIKDRYLTGAIKIEDIEVEFSEAELARCVFTYTETIDFATMVFNKYVDGKDVDFELSIDETATPTLPVEHYFIANELYRNGVKLITVAPRFCGEFQKGIDYIGDLVQFEKEMKIHAAIARNFGYKLSIHSGSDKFSTFEIIGKYTKGNFHVKTAGTNWLEAMKVVAQCDPAMYREIHKFALSRFNDACKFYHVTTNLNNIPNVDTLKDNELVDLFKNNDCRQLIHITYGFILTDKDAKGDYFFKDKLFKLWDEKADVYASMLESHIGHHLELLYKGFNK